MQIAICAALYEAGRPYLAAFVDGIAGAAAAHDVRFVGAVDGLDNATDALRDLSARLEVTAVSVPAGHTPAGVRRSMLSAGLASGADILVFIDMDDVLAPDALERHLAALSAADFSYGDLDLIDAAGHGVGRRFFDDAAVPDEVDDVIAIAGRNFLGFSNTAVRANRIAPVALAVPEDVVAADWWFFTMLVLGGLRGRKTNGSVAAYRIHDANLLGAGAPRTRSAAIAQTAAMLHHYRAFSTHPELAARAAAAVQALVNLRGMSAQDFAGRFAAMDGRGDVWFDGVWRIADELAAMPGAGARQTANGG